MFQTDDKKGLFVNTNKLRQEKWRLHP